MLRLSKMADYAGVVVVHMVATPERVHTATSLAIETGLPKATVAKCLKMLARHEILTSLRGASGGYRLARSPREIAVADVIAAMEGKMKIASCTDGHKSDCQIEHSCPMRGGWDSLNAKIGNMLKNTSLADMVAPRDGLAGGIAQIKDIS